MNPIYFTRIESGAFTSRNVRQLIASLEGAQVEVMLRKRRSYRTLPQNAYYHGVVVRMIADRMRELGVEGRRGPIKDEEVHELLKVQFLTYSQLVNPETGEYVTMMKSTTELTRSEMGDYITQCKVWAQDTFGVEIPDPNEQLTFA